MMSEYANKQILQQIDFLISNQKQWKVLSSHENRLLNQYINYIQKQYELTKLNQIQQLQLKSISKSNSTQHKKKIILKTPNIRNKQRFRTQNSQSSSNKYSQRISLLKSSIYKTKTPTAAVRHLRNNSQYLLSIGGKKQISLSKTKCSTHKIINFNTQQKNDQSDIKVTEFNITQKFASNTFKKHKNDDLRMCFGCQQLIAESQISSHQNQCAKIAKMYQLSEQQLLSIADEKISNKKQNLLSRINNKGQQIRNLYEKIYEYLHDQNQYNFQDQPLEQIQKQSIAVIQCLSEFQKYARTRQIRSALEKYSDIQYY